MHAIRFLPDAHTPRWWVNGQQFRKHGSWYHVCKRKSTQGRIAGNPIPGIRYNSRAQVVGEIHQGKRVSVSGLFQPERFEPSPFSPNLGEQNRSAKRCRLFLFIS